MKTTIDNEAEFKSAIDQYGQALDAIAAKRQEANVLKGMLEVYASANRIKSAATDAYELAMKKQSAALRLAPGTTEAQVVANLKKTPSLKGYVTETYDAAGIKQYAKTLKRAERVDLLDGVGLSLTEPNPHAVVTPVGQ